MARTKKTKKKPGYKGKRRQQEKDRENHLLNQQHSRCAKCCRPAACRLCASLNHHGMATARRIPSRLTIAPRFCRPSFLQSLATPGSSANNDGGGVEGQVACLT